MALDPDPEAMARGTLKQPTEAHPLRVAMDARALIASGWSLHRYTAELMHGLAELGVDLTAWIGGWHLPALRASLTRELGNAGLSVPIRMARLPGALLYGRRGPRLWPHSAYMPVPGLLPRQADLFHALHWPFPLRRRPPAVLTVHDLIALRHPEWAPPGAEGFCRGIAALAPQAAHVIVDSDAVREELLALSSVQPERVTTVPLGVRAAAFARQMPPAQVAEVKARHGLDRPYFLAIGTIEPRKNLTTVIRAYDLCCERGYADWDLRIIGARVTPLPDFDDLLRRPRTGTIHLAEQISDDDLTVLMQQAGGFVFVSLAEGFGLPVLEAFAAGTPVVTSSVAPLCEVAGEAALLADPTDPEAIAAALARLAQEPELCQRLVTRGRQRAAEFTWQRTARLTLDVYRHVLAAQ